MEDGFVVYVERDLFFFVIECGGMIFFWIGSFVELFMGVEVYYICGVDLEYDLLIFDFVYLNWMGSCCEFRVDVIGFKCVW